MSKCLKQLKSLTVLNSPLIEVHSSAPLLGHSITLQWQILSGYTAFPALAALSSFERPTSLRQIIASDLLGLETYRKGLDSIIDLWVSELTFEHLAFTLTYANMAGVKSNKNLGAVLQHFFNHQTHHRGQVSTLLFQAGIDVGITDLITFIPDDNI